MAILAMLGHGQDARVVRRAKARHGVPVRPLQRKAADLKTRSASEFGLFGSPPVTAPFPPDSELFLTVPVSAGRLKPGAMFKLGHHRRN